jgi:hypothetical protein
VKSYLQAWSGAFTVTLVTAGLVFLNIADGSVRRWASRDAFATSVASGILVLLLTLLIVDRVNRSRQLRDRSRAIAAQAAIVFNQAARGAQAVVAALDTGGDRDAASDQLRTYMTMLLISSPVLIDASLSRTFLEEAQTLGGRLAIAMSRTRSSDASDELRAGLDDAVDRLRVASQPLLAILRPDEQQAVTPEAPPAATAALHSNGSHDEHS